MFYYTFGGFPTLSKLAFMFIDPNQMIMCIYHKKLVIGIF